MRRLYVKLRKEEVEALVRLAEAHRRHPSAEAGELLAKAIKRYGQHLAQEAGPQPGEVQPCPH